MIKVKNLIRKFGLKVAKIFPIDKNKILFFSYYGEHYSGSPKYLSEYIIEHSNYKVVWAFTKPDRYSNLKNIKCVKYGSFHFIKEFATAKIIITNYRLPLEYTKRKKQIYVQTWHSSLRLKMIEKDASKTLTDNYIKMAKKDSEQIDLLLAGSKKSKEIFQHSFWYNGNIMESGTPQCDIFFKNLISIRRKVQSYFQLKADIHIALYAPTFRKNHSLDAYDINYQQLLVNLENKFGGKWVLLIRLHPHLINLMRNLIYSENILSATQYDDVQELLSVSDILITDYSAIMFDFAITKKPCFLYTSDIKTYKREDRDLYFDIEKLPFDHAENNQELTECIRNFDLEKYQKQMELFLKREIATFDDGNACERVYVELEKIRKGNNEK